MRNRFFGMIAIVAVLAFGFIACDSSIEYEVTVTFTVTFDAGGGSPTPAPQIVNEGGVATRPDEDPIKDDYEFSHWSLQDRTTPFNFNTPIRSDITLLAQWHLTDTGTYGNFLWQLRRSLPPQQNEWMIIIGYIGSDTDITIPREIHSIPVTSIGNSAFADSQLTSVTIPNSVTSIEGGAFANNQLTSITIPNSVTSIGDHAFARNQITSVVIPNSVTFIGFEAFARNQLTSVVIPNSVTSIGMQAFYSNQLTSVTIPNSVTSIYDWVFSSNQLTSITIGANVTLWVTAFHQGSPPVSSGFWEAYNATGRLAGTYTRPNTASTVWTRRP